MHTLRPINLNNGTIHIHPYRKADMVRVEQMREDLFEILSDFENTEQIPERRIKSLSDSDKLMLGVTLGYAQQLQWTHFLSLVQHNNKIIGQIDVLSPEKVFAAYKLSNLWLIEYYLHKQLWGKGIMSSALAALIDNLKEQGIVNIGALCKTNNLSSIKVLTNVGFKFSKKFDNLQNLYLLQ